MNTIIDVPTGKIEVGDANTVLYAPAIGSCVVVSVYNLEKKLGAMAHVMLPGKSPTNDFDKKTKYARDAINQMLNKMTDLGIDTNVLDVCLVGGANVLQKSGDITGEKNINSIVKFLKEKNIKIKAQALGGIMRRSATFDVGKGTLFYSEGDEDEKQLWAAEKQSCPRN